MHFMLWRWLILIAALAPFAYYLLSIWCAWRFFSQPRQPAAEFTPPASILKPVRGLDAEAYENFASFCRLDYPEYEILFGVSDADDPAVPVIQRLIREFPQCSIRLLIGAESIGQNNKVCKLCRLVREARHDLLVMSDSDVRVERDYLRCVAAPFRDPAVGGITTLFRGLRAPSLVAELDCAGTSAEFCSGAIVARQLEGVKFMLGATMATTRRHLAEIGGFEPLADLHSDDFVLGNRLAGLGYRIELIRKPVWMMFPAQTFREYWRHELRWAIGLRHIRPKGHLGLALTHGLPWALAAAAVSPVPALRIAYPAAYLFLRLLMAWIVGVRGLKDPILRRRLWLVPVRDALAFPVWLASFLSNRIRWRGGEFTIRDGRLVPISPSAGRG